MNNLYLIIGDNQELIDFNLKKIFNKIDYSDEYQINYDLSINKLSDVIDEASMMSLFSNTKIIVGTNFDMSKVSDDDYTYLEKYLNNYNKDVVIILITEKVDARLKI